jgi:SAM-dependent methyltransferase
MRTVPEPDPRSAAEIYGPESEKYGLHQFEDAENRVLWREYSERILRDVAVVHSGEGRLLDVGCNVGDLLFLARARGWEAEGLEINKANAHHLRDQGFNVYTETIQEAPIEDDRYDCVVANQVLEHIPDPNGFLRSVQRVLCDGGVFFVGVPCFWSPIPLLLKRDDWYALVPEEHVWQFSVGSLRALLGKHEFRIEHENRGSSEFWGKPSFRPRDLARWTVYRLVDVMRQGDFINVTARNMKSGANDLSGYGVRTASCR